MPRAEPSSSGAAAPPPIECRNLWKIFGDRTAEALRAAKEEGLGKADLLSRLNCVVGVADATFSVGKGRSSASWACRAAESPPWCGTSTG